MAKQFDLYGVAPHAFSIISYTSKAMRRANFPENEIEKYQKDALCGEYEKLIMLSMNMVEKANEKLLEEEKNHKLIKEIIIEE